MTFAIIGIGIQGSGKTRWFKKFLEKGADVVYICPDDIRQEMTGDAANQSVNDKVWEEAYNRVREALEAGKNVIIDATNSDPIDRRRLVKHCNAYATETIGVWLQASLDTCLKRNAGRGREVPRRKLRAAAGLLAVYPPKEIEGFKLLMRVDNEASD